MRDERRPVPCHQSVTVIATQSAYVDLTLGLSYVVVVVV